MPQFAYYKVQDIRWELVCSCRQVRTRPIWLAWPYVNNFGSLFDCSPVLEIATAAKSESLAIEGAPFEGTVSVNS